MKGLFYTLILIFSNNIIVIGQEYLLKKQIDDSILKTYCGTLQAYITSSSQSKDKAYKDFLFQFKDGDVEVCNDMYKSPYGKTFKVKEYALTIDAYPLYNGNPYISFHFDTSYFSLCVNKDTFFYIRKYCVIDNKEVSDVLKIGVTNIDKKLKIVSIEKSDSSYDTDMDRVPNECDKCPDEFGSVNNHGCPIIDDIQKAKNLLIKGGFENTKKGIEALWAIEKNGNLDGEAYYLLANAYKYYSTVLLENKLSLIQIKDGIENYAHLSALKGFKLGDELYSKLINEKRLVDEESDRQRIQKKIEDERNRKTIEDENLVRQRNEKRLEDIRNKKNLDNEELQRLRNQKILEDERIRKANEEKEFRQGSKPIIKTKTYNDYDNSILNSNLALGLNADYGIISFLNPPTDIEPGQRYHVRLGFSLDWYSSNSALGLHAETNFLRQDFQLVQGRITDSFTIKNLELPVCLRIGLGQEKNSCVALGAVFTKPLSVFKRDDSFGFADNTVEQAISNYLSVMAIGKYATDHVGISVKAKYDLKDVFNKNYPYPILSNRSDNKFDLRFLQISLGLSWIFKLKSGSTY